MLTGKLAYAESEQGSVGAQLQSLYTIPSRVFDLPVSMDGTVTSVKVKMRLLTDRENEEVAEIADRYGTSSRMLMERRAILARSIEWIENNPVKMPEVLIDAIESRVGSPPSDVEQAFWVLQQSQSAVLQTLIDFYTELQTEQRVAVDEIKKKFVQLTVESQIETPSSE